MKKFFAIALCVVAPSAFAQTCIAPGGPATAANVPFTVSGNSCAGADTTFGGSICSGSQTFDPANPVAIYEVDVTGATNSFNMTVADTAPYDAAIALIGPGACSNAASCGLQGNDANGAGGGETLPDGGGNTTQPIGTYYAAVFSFNTGTAGCGAYTLTVNPTLPVQLQSFTVG